jgi:hypothetical protein
MPDGMEDAKKSGGLEKSVADCLLRLHRRALFMKKGLFILLAAAQAAFAQTPSATPKPPFPGFGTSLDQRPPSYRNRSAQTPPSISRIPQATSSLNFEVRSVGTGGGADTVDQKSPLGRALATKVKVRKSQTVLELRVRNLSAQPATAQFDWFFLAQGSAGARRGGSYVWDQGKVSIPVAPAAEIQQNLESKELLETTSSASVRQYDDKKYIGMMTETSVSGARPIGWIVRMFVDGKLIRVRASSSELETTAHDANAMAALLARRPPQVLDGPGVFPR